jgi:transposase-like protein
VGEPALAPLLGAALRRRRSGPAGARWDVDAPSVNVQGQWQSLARAMDRDGVFGDVRLSDTRARAAAVDGAREAPGAPHHGWL